MTLSSASLLPLLFLAAAEEETPFTQLASFATEAACDVRLREMAAEARAGSWVAVEGPYTIAAGDRRIHMVQAMAGGHSITERRCLGSELSTRSWEHSMGGAASDEPDTIESMAADAEWLKKR